MFSCSMWISAQCLCMDGGLQSLCIGHFYCADVAVNCKKASETHKQFILTQITVINGNLS